MTDTVHLGLPFIEGSQAQKHITHNEALRILDAVIQIGVSDTDRTAPPLTPAEGDRHIVASGATGAWVDHADAVAVYEDGAWRFLVPKPGWCAWSAADGALLVFDGEAWTAAAGGGGGSIPDSVDMLGINGAASDPNLLTVTSNAALFQAIAVADGGTGDMRVQISKEDDSGTASVVFSNAFGGHAEFGLVESDSFKLKVSGDGETFVEAMTFDPETGNAAFQRGIAFPGVVTPPQITSSQNDYAPADFAAASTLRLSSDASRTITGLAGGSEGRIIIVHNVGSNNIVIANQDSASDAPNRFLFGGSVTLGSDAALSLRYDGTTQRWRPMSPTGGSGEGGAAGGMTDVERQNLNLGLIGQSKLFAEYRRLMNLFVTGFKGANDAANGIDAGSSSSYVAAAGSGFVAPSMSGTTQTIASNSGTADFTTGYTVFDLNTALTAADVINAIGVYRSSAATLTVKIGKRNSAGNFDIVVSESFSHPGGGWADHALASSYTVPSSGSYYVGIYTTGNDVATASIARGYKAGSNATGTGQSGFTEDSGSGVPLRVIKNSSVGNMTLVTVPQATDSTMNTARVLLEYDNAASPVLNTDLTVEVSCDGGSNWASAALAAVTSHGQGGRSVAETGDQACTAGTSLTARIKTVTNKNVPIHGVSLSARHL